MGMGWRKSSVAHFAEQIEKSDDLLLLEAGARLLGMFKESLKYDMSEWLKDCPKLSVLVLEMPASGKPNRGDPMRGLICQMAYSNQPDPIGGLAQCLVKEDGHY